MIYLQPADWYYSIPKSDILHDNMTEGELEKVVQSEIEIAEIEGVELRHNELLNFFLNWK